MAEVDELYRNTGAPFHRADGSQVLTDQVFVPTAEEMRLWRYKLRKPETHEPPPPPVRAAPPAMPAVVAKPAAKPALSTVDPRWTLVMQPARYLQLHPEGQYAELAREIVAKQQPAASAEDEA